MAARPQNAAMGQLVDLLGQMENDEAHELKKFSLSLHEILEDINLLKKIALKGWSILHCAVSQGYEDVVTKVLTLQPNMVSDITKNGATVFHIAAKNGQEKMVTQLLEMCPVQESHKLIHTTAKDDWTPLHWAAACGNDKIVAKLLEASPALIDAVTDEGWTALHWAIQRGHDKVVTQLLALHPASIDALTASEVSVLHIAAWCGNNALVARLLALKPELLNALDQRGRSVLHFAALGKRESTVRSLLAYSPELVKGIDQAEENTVLHVVLENCKHQRELVEDVWRLNPQALHIANSEGATPFHIAVRYELDYALELFQWSLTIDEIELAYQQNRGSLGNYVERFKPVLEAQCELLTVWLPGEVVKVVVEYFDFNHNKRHPKRYRSFEE